MRQDWQVRAYTAAFTRLTHEHWDRYRELHDQVKAEIRAARMKGEPTPGNPQSRAKTRLAREHRDRFRELYVEERRRLQQQPAGQRQSEHPVGVHWRPGR